MALDDTSIKIGEFGADLKNLLRLHTIIDDKLGKVIDTIPVVHEVAKRAHERLDELVDPEHGILAEINNTAKTALKYAEDYNENKKKAVFAGGLLVSLGAFFAWLGGVFFK